MPQARRKPARRGGADETVTAGAGADTLLGGADADRLTGGAGSDLLQGGDGDDRLYASADAVADIFAGGDGLVGSLDLAYATAATVVTLSETAGAGAVSGGGFGADSFSGIERVYGSNTDTDTITGSSLAEYLYGNGGNDAINAGSGSDRLFGGQGADTLTDYNAAADTMLIDDIAFIGLTEEAGFLSSTQFALGTMASNGLQRIIYDQATGTLAYDSDGSGALAQVNFAHLAAGTVLTRVEFDVI